MRKICNQCQTEMIEECDVTVQRAMYGIKISKKRKGFFNSVTAIPKAAVCPNCGNLMFYIDKYKEFKE